MKLKKLKLNNVLLEKKSMTQLVGGKTTGVYKCGCGCGELESGYTNAAGMTQSNYDEAWQK